MRVIGGRLSGRRFGAPSGKGTRPTSDRVREALGSALTSRGAFEGARVLDLFAGSGALSFESISRGAKHATMIDRDARVLREIKQSASALGVAPEVTTLRIDLCGKPETFIDRIGGGETRFSLVFADAPYANIASVPPLIEALAAAGRFTPGAWIVVEHPDSYAWTWTKGLASDAEYRYGHTRISLGVNQQKGTT
ncbi:MAG: RsmD family RNA methyltransferase [Polyangiales bacterium]